MVAKINELENQEFVAKIFNSFIIFRRTDIDPEFMTSEGLNQPQPNIQEPYSSLDNRNNIFSYSFITFVNLLNGKK